MKFQIVKDVLYRSVGKSADREKQIGIINNLELTVQNLSDSQIQEKVQKLIKQYQQEKNYDSILCESFALTREASKRKLGLRHFNSQIYGGLVLHNGKIAEMMTGEGKTLAATLPVSLNALSLEGIHVVTVNDYLAKRDQQSLSQLYQFLGLSVGLIQENMNSVERRKNYNADITYVTNSELAFDYLRDNMATEPSELVQRPFNYCVVDEIDSILIDEARTPLIISGISDKPVEKYIVADEVQNYLKPKLHYTVDEKAKNVTLTGQGIIQIQKILNVNNLYKLEDPWVPYILNAIRAHVLYIREVNYIVKNREIQIVDEFTGRIMANRRWSDGLHQAIEAKEKQPIQKGSETLASITYQNFFLNYPKLAGMTGTARTSEVEFESIYNLKVESVEPNKTMIRKDFVDAVYQDELSKWKAVADECENAYSIGCPVLLGTTSIEKSEKISDFLEKKKIKHNALNAKHHEQEAKIIAEAGKINAVTIATNMAGRGTDIKLGGAEDSENLEKEMKVSKDSGGLYIIGTERHESRRIDNQLRGRSGRQGDPGSSQFYVSLEDNLMRLFGTERIAKMMDRMGLEEGEVIQHSMITKSIERAQKKIEENNFGIRKRLLEYDDVMNAQRTVIYKKRKHALFGERLAVDIDNMIYDTSEAIVNEYQTLQDLEGFKLELIRFLSIDCPVDEAEFKSLKSEELTNKVYKSAITNYKIKSEVISQKTYPVIKDVYENQSATYQNIVIPFTDGLKTLQVVTNLKEAFESEGGNIPLSIEKGVSLAIIDESWKENLRELDDLKQSVQNATYEQKDPLLIYKFESFNLFKQMIEKVNKDIVSFLMKANLPEQTSVQQEKQQKQQKLETSRELDNLNSKRKVNKVSNKTIPISVEKEIGRNEKVKITDGSEIKEIKWKKAKPLVDSGKWRKI